MHYIYCPKCGRELTDKPAGDEGSVPYCEACGKYWFDSFSNCAIVLVANEAGEIALLTQNYLSDTYKNYVSGYIVPGETAEETARREVREELGITLERLDYAGTHWFARNDVLMHAFIGYAKKCAFTLSPEVDAAEWVPAGQVPALIFPDRPGNTQHILYRKYLADNTP